MMQANIISASEASIIKSLVGISECYAPVGRVASPAIDTLLAETDLLHEGYEIVHKILLDNLPVIPLSDCVEVDVK